MSSPIPPDSSLHARGGADGQITMARRLVVMAISLVLAVLLWVAFRLHEAGVHESRPGSSTSVAGATRGS